MTIDNLLELVAIALSNTGCISNKSPLQVTGITMHIILKMVPIILKNANMQDVPIIPQIMLAY